MWRVPQHFKLGKRFSSKIGALSAAEILLMMGQPKRRGRKRRIPTTAVYYKNRHCEVADRVVRVKLRSACHEDIVSPPMSFWSAVRRSKYAYMRHAVILPNTVRSNALRTCLLIWYSVEYLDGRPITDISRRLGLRTYEGGPVQGPVAVCTFSLHTETVFSRFGAKCARILGSGEWVHLPNLDKCVKAATGGRGGKECEV